MAYVRKTDALWREITGQINAMFDARSKHAEDWYRHGMTREEFDRRIYDAAIPQAERDLLNALGEKYFKQHTEFTVRIAHQHNVSPDTERTYHYNVKIDTPQYLPFHWQDHWSRNPVLVTDPELVAIAIKRREAITAISSERAEFTNKVQKLYAAAASVNDFVKTWPAGHDLLPKHAKDKLAEKAERTKSAAKEAINVDELSVHMLKARIAA